MGEYGTLLPLLCLAAAWLRELCTGRASCPPDCFETTRKKLLVILLAIRAWLATKCNAFIKTSFEGAEGSEFEAAGDCRNKRAQLLLGSLSRGEGGKGRRQNSLVWDVYIFHQSVCARINKTLSLSLHLLKAQLITAGMLQGLFLQGSPES